MITSRISKFVPLIFIISIVLVVISASKVLAGGGPQYTCKEMATRQGWLIDTVQTDQELSDKACIVREPTFNEKDEILDFCKSEPKGDFRNDCLEKCRKYYSNTGEFRKCDRNESLKIKTAIYISGIKEFLNSGSLLSTVFITLAIMTVFYGALTIFKKVRRHSKADIK